MATIDIREGETKVTGIKFADDRKIYLSKDEFVLVEGKAYNAAVRFEDVENLIKALQKAVELGWTK